MIRDHHPLPPILVLSPCERPDAGLVAAACAAGALGVLELGRDPARARHALAALGHPGSWSAAIARPRALLLNSRCLWAIIGGRSTST